MNFASPQEWIAWGGIVIPLMTLAWSAVAYTNVRRRETQHQEYRRFFEITDQLGHSGGSIASKIAAAYELRKYSQYKTVILNICDKTQIEGPSAEMLKDELAATADFLRFR